MAQVSDNDDTGKRDAPDHTAPLIDGDYEGDGVPVSIDDHEIAAAIERANKSGAEAVGVEEAWEAYKRQQPIMYGGEREAFYAAWQASQTRDGWRVTQEQWSAQFTAGHHAGQLYAFVRSEAIARDGQFPEAPTSNEQAVADRIADAIDAERKASLQGEQQ